jgi:hypothetical protein
MSDFSELVLVLLAALVAGALLAVLPQWRRLMRTAPALPIHRHFAGQAGFEAELRCAFCAGRQECLRRGKPLDDCPNLELLQKRKAL